MIYFNTGDKVVFHDYPKDALTVVGVDNEMLTILVKNNPSSAYAMWYAQDLFRLADDITQ